MRKRTYVSVIASFDAKGHVLPLYVRIGGQALKITNCISLPLETYEVTSEKFACKINDGKVERTLELRFSKQNQIWSIPSAIIKSICDDDWC